MKKLLSFMFIASLLLVSCEVEQFDGQELTSVDGKASKKGTASASSLTFEMDGCSGSERDLIAGQNMVVGSVSVEEVGEDYVITYNITEEGYCLTEAHVDVATKPDDLNNGFAVTKSGNPKIGNFDYVNDGVECMQNFSVTVANTGPWLAIHGVVVCSSDSPETIFANLPETADFCTNALGDLNSYLGITITNGGALSGVHGAYCVDNDALIAANNCPDDGYADATVHISTESLPAGIENTGNINAVNWILNQDFSEVYTSGDIQYAIWLLLDPIEDDQPGLNTLGTYSIANAEAIVAMALDHLDFVPGCDDYIGIILKKDGIQPVIIPFKLECRDCDETVWAEGCEFPGSSWAMYFHYE